MNIVVIIQARLGSTRLPKKVLMRLIDKTVLEQVVARVAASRRVNEIIVATTTKAEDDEIEKVCAAAGVKVYRGSENDVLDRYFQAANLIGGDHIVRITADCPLMDPAIIDEVIALHLKNNADYTTNTILERYPDGEDVEVIKFTALKKAAAEAKLASEREHVTPYLKNHPELFKQASLEAPTNWSAKRWTLDNREDFDFISRLYDGLYAADPLFGLEKILSFLEARPELEAINRHISRNAGYAKSLREDKTNG